MTMMMMIIIRAAVHLNMAAPNVNVNSVCKVGGWVGGWVGSHICIHIII